MSFSARVRSHIPSYSQYYWLIGWPDLAWEGTTQKRENWKARVVGGGGELASGAWLPQLLHSVILCWKDLHGHWTSPNRV